MILTLSAKTFTTFYALDSFRVYFLENERLIQRAADDAEFLGRPQWTPQTEEEEGEFRHECQEARRLHDSVMIPLFRNASLAMLYTITEREILRVLDNLAKERNTAPFNRKARGDFLKRASQFCRSHGIDLPAIPHYQSITDLQKIRNCIVHCRGELALLNPDDVKYFLEQLPKTRPGFLAWDISAEIEIEAECITKFTQEVWTFFRRLFGLLAWDIDLDWSEKEWTQI
jgi:hypothetical protein